MQWSIQRYGLIGSTNDEARALAMGGAPDGTVVVAEGQTAGRGRLTRAWFSPQGCNLYASIVLRPKVATPQLPSLTLVVGLAACDAIEQFVPVPPQVKWPNDLWIAGKKVGGILSEVTSDQRLSSGALAKEEPATSDAFAVIIGLGINVNLRQDKFPHELRPTATSLAVMRGQPLDRELVLRSFLHTFAMRYARWQREGFVAMRKDYLLRSAIEGHRIRVTLDAQQWEGIVRGVDERGALLLETSARKIEPILAGTVDLL